MPQNVTNGDLLQFPISYGSEDRRDKETGRYTGRPCPHGNKGHYCKECRSEYFQRTKETRRTRRAFMCARWYANNRTAIRQRQAEKRYGMSPGEWSQRFEAQGRKCACCESARSGGKGWHVDHDHSCCSGKKSCGKCTRGIICHSCNQAMGLVKDSTERLRKLAEYLERNSQIRKEVLA